MAPKDWRLIDEENPLQVPAKPASGLWTLARSRLLAPHVLRIMADGAWTPVAGLRPCGPDGIQSWPFGREQLLFKKAPLGALIAKIGGSDSSADDGDLYAIGTCAVLALDKSSGPLFFTINDVPGFYDDNSGSVTVSIS